MVGTPKKPLYKRWWVWLIGIIILIAIATRDENSNRHDDQASSDAQSETRPHDDLTLFISRYGTPDSVQSSENEVPRPPIVTRWLIYQKENIRAVYVPGAPVGSPPPYKKWKLFGFQNHTTNEVISPAEVVKLMAYRDRTNGR